MSVFAFNFNISTGEPPRKAKQLERLPSLLDKTRRSPNPFLCQNAIQAHCQGNGSSHPISNYTNYISFINQVWFVWYSPTKHEYDSRAIQHYRVGISVILQDNKLAFYIRPIRYIPPTQQLKPSHENNYFKTNAPFSLITHYPNVFNSLPYINGVVSLVLVNFAVSFPGIGATAFLLRFSPMPTPIPLRNLFNRYINVTPTKEVRFRLNEARLTQNKNLKHFNSLILKHSMPRLTPTSAGVKFYGGE